MREQRRRARARKPAKGAAAVAQTLARSGCRRRGRCLRQRPSCRGRRPALCVSAVAGMTTDEIRRFFVTEFPQSEVTIEEVGGGAARVRQSVSTRHLRPGGTVSGPVLVGVADSAMYAARWARSVRSRSPSRSASASTSCASQRPTAPSSARRASSARQAARGRRGHDPVRRCPSPTRP